MNSYNYVARFASDNSVEIVANDWTTCIKKARKYCYESEVSWDTIKIFNKENKLIETIDFKRDDF